MGNYNQVGALAGRQACLHLEVDYPAEVCIPSVNLSMFTMLFLIGKLTKRSLILQVSYSPFLLPNFFVFVVFKLFFYC